MAMAWRTCDAVHFVKLVKPQLTLLDLVKVSTTTGTYVTNSSKWSLSYSKDTVNIGGVSITNYTFAEVNDVPGLGVSYSLVNFDKICGG